MRFLTHLSFAFFVGSIAIVNIKSDFIYSTMFLAGCILFSTLPDIDMPESTIGKNIKFISAFFKHRGIFHSTVFYLSVIFVISFFYYNELLVYSFLIGTFSHILLDGLTKKGVAPFYPITTFRIRGFFKTGNFLEWVLIFSFATAGILALFIR